MDKFIIQEGYGTEPVYDLRLSRANIITKHWELVCIARLQKDYVKWIEAINSLYTVSEHLIIQKSKSVYTEFEEKLKAFKEIANQYSTTYLGRNKKAEAISAIEEQLHALERFLYRKISDAGGFGTNRRIPGL